MIKTRQLQPKLGLPSQDQAPASQKLFQQAKTVLAGGISSSARATTTGNLPYPLYLTRGCGSRVWDADGHEYIDYLLSYGAVILGHANTEITAAVTDQLQRGTMFGTCNTVEVELAGQIRSMVPGADLVRFASSGSEAICGAIRAARGFTGKSKILKFEGHYHGWVDVLAISNRPNLEEAGALTSPASHPHSRGIPQGVVDDVIIAPWNELEILKAILQRHGDKLAAVMLEPMVANNACIMPQPGFLECIRQECSRRNIVLIFDEIVTGFRVAPGGAAQLLKIVPDMAVFSKAIGGGFPISAFTGRRDIMELVAANISKHGGTYNGNPLCAAAALATLKKLNQPGVLEAIDAHGRLLIDAIHRAAHDRRIPCVVQGVGTMFQVIFGTDGRPLRHYRDLLKVDTRTFAAFRQSLLEHGVHINNSGSACWFVSAAHRQEDGKLAEQAIQAAMQSIS